MQLSPLKVRNATVLVCGAAALAVAAPVAFAHQAKAKTPTVVGNAAAGKAPFSTTCGTCHTLKAAASMGTLGPNLNKIPKLTEAEIISQIEVGGTALMVKTHQSTKAYPSPMPSESSLGKTEIDNIAAFVYKYQS